MNTTIFMWRDDHRMIDAIAANPGVLGGSLSEVLNIPRSTVNKRLKAMMRAGMVGRYAVNKYRLHYFTTQADADAAGPRLLAEYAAMQLEWRQATERRYAKRRHDRIALGGVKHKRKTPAQLLRNIDTGRYAVLDRTILRLAEGPDGFRSGKPMTLDGTVYSVAVIATRVLQMVNFDGLLFRARINGKRVHYFTSAQRAGEWLLSGCGARAAPVRIKRLPTNPDAPVDYSRAKITIAPPPRDRWAVEVPQFGGQISADYYLMRQGVDVRAVLALT